MIIYYGAYSTTDGKKYRIGYEEENQSTERIIFNEIKDSEIEDENDFLQSNRHMNKSR